MANRTIALILMAAGIVLTAFPVFAEDPAKTVEAEGQVILGDDSTIGQAKAAALNNARRNALEKATGVTVHGSSTVYNFQLINDLVITATKGVITAEKVIENTCKEKNAQLFCTAKIEAQVKPLNLERRGDFAVTRALVRRFGSEASKQGTVFQSKDEIQIQASSNQDAYLNVFSVDQVGNVARLYPNDFCGFELLPAGKDLAIPDAHQRESGLKFRVLTPKGSKRSVESVLIIAMKNKNILLAQGAENPTITDLMQELSGMDPSLWVDKAVGYEVRE